MRPPPRAHEQRKRDTLRRLEDDIDAWVATADPDTGNPYMIPLSFLWDGDTVLIATPASSPTGRNLQSMGKVRIGIGTTRDVVLIEGETQSVPASKIGSEEAESFAAKTGFDPRLERETYLYFRILPTRIQAWRESNELAGRELMRQGRWLV